MIAIVIPAADKSPDSKDQLTKLLNSIIDGGYYEECPAFVCLDRTSEEFTEYFMEKHSGPKYMLNSGNRMYYAKNANRGIRQALKDYPNTNAVMIANQDCILPKYSVIKEFDYANKISVGISVPEGTTLGRVPGDPQPLDNKFAFSCPIIGREVIDKIGYLEEALITHEDDDYIARARLAGFETYKVPFTFFHRGDHINPEGDWQSPSGCYGQETLAFNHSKYRAKWQVPLVLTHEQIIPWILKNYQNRPEVLFHS